MNFSRRRLLIEQIVVVAVLGCGMKVDAMWHVPQHHSLTLPRSRIRDSATATLTPGDGTTTIKVEPSA